MFCLGLFPTAPETQHDWISILLNDISYFHENCLSMDDAKNWHNTFLGSKRPQLENMAKCNDFSLPPYLWLMLTELWRRTAPPDYQIGLLVTAFKGSVTLNIINWNVSIFCEWLSDKQNECIFAACMAHVTKETWHISVFAAVPNNALILNFLYFVTSVKCASPVCNNGKG